MPSPLCHRCSATLVPGMVFCAECGAPQLRVQPADEQAAEADGSGEQTPWQASHRHSVRWQAAIAAAAIIALPVGLLSSFLAFSTLWVMAGAVWTIALYRRRVPGRLSSATGSRIGIVLGLFAAVISTATDAASLLINRYGLHHGAEMDQQYRAAAQEFIDHAIAQNPTAATQIPWFFRFCLSPDGHAAFILLSAILWAASMLGFSALGGALGARYYGRRPRTA